MKSKNLQEQFFWNKYRSEIRPQSKKYNSDYPIDPKIKIDCLFFIQK